MLTSWTSRRLASTFLCTDGIFSTPPEPDTRTWHSFAHKNTHQTSHIRTFESNKHILGSTAATFSVLLADIPPSAPRGEAAPHAPVCSGSVCGCHDIGRSQWCCSSAGAEPIPDWAPAQRERPHLIQHDHTQSELTEARQRPALDDHKH